MAAITKNMLCLIALLLALVYGLVKFFRVALRTRAFYRDTPGIPHHPFWGHMKSMAKYMIDDKHFDHPASEMWQDLGKPPFYFIDSWPILRPGLVVVGDAELADQVHKPTPERPYGFPKDRNSWQMYSIIGPNSMVFLSGEPWKALRKRYSPGFSSRNLQMFLPEIITEAKVFASKLEKSVGKVITLRDFTLSLTMDIISSVTLGHTMHAQTTKTKLLYGLSGLVDWQLTQERQDPFHLFNPLRRPMQWYYERHFNSAVDHEILRSIEEEKQLTRKSIINLALTNEKEPDHSQTSPLDAREQVKAFIFGGYDTTATLLEWLFYELSINPTILSQLRAEHRSIFGSSTDSNVYHASVEQMLTDHPDAVLASMPYTTAVIKETLRFHNVVSPARDIPAGANFSLPDRKGKMWSLDDHTVYLPGLIYHRDEEYYGADAGSFKPERWLEGAEWKIPTVAFQAFGRGPRACIGQELVWLEAKVIVALTIMRFDFEKVFDTKYKEIYNVRRITAKPNDGMRMRVKRAVVE